MNVNFSASYTPQGLAPSYAPSRSSIEQEQALSASQQAAPPPPPQTSVEPDTERPVEEVTALEPQELSTTTQDALRSRPSTPETTSAQAQAANNQALKIPYEGAINSEGVEAERGGSTVDIAA